MSDSGFGNSSEIQSEHRDSIRALVTRFNSSERLGNAYVGAADRCDSRYALVIARRFNLSTDA